MSSSNWRNRIVRHEDIDPHVLIPNPQNYRDHPDYQKLIMSGALDELGWLQSVQVVDKTNHLIDGHMRVMLAIEHNQPTVPVDFLDLSEEEERKALLTIDPIGSFAKENTERIKSLAESIKFNTDAMRELSLGIARKYGFLPKLGNDDPKNTGAETGANTDQIDNKANEYLADAAQKWATSIGDVWEVGKHILICGDCEDNSVFAYLTGGRKLASVNTDPPYGIDIVGSDGRIGYGAKFGDVEGDKSPFDPAHIFRWSDNITIWGANHFSDKLPSSPCWLVWDKREGDRHNDQADCELAWCSGEGVVRIFHHMWMGFARASERGMQRIHPTQKPVAVIKWSIEERTKPGDIVVDMYAGSGTTIIACHETGRVCYAIEKDPRYVSSALKRFEEVTGTQPKIIERIA